MIGSSSGKVTNKIKLLPSDITFLILEDMDNIRQQMVNDLRSIGVLGKIHEAPNVQTAIKIYSSEEIGFVISDWNLPDGTGHDFLKKFRDVERYKKTPFIMCTTNNEVKFFIEAIASGANDYVVKPWKINELKEKIQLTWNTFLKKK
ncbi:MAG: response regulator [Bacteriovorax sp.]|nr:response regulator [Bacteriovorax sp.]